MIENKIHERALAYPTFISRKAVSYRYREYR